MAQNGVEENDKGWRLLNGSDGVKDVDKAIFWFEKSAELGCGTAMVNLGNIYEDRGDFEKAYYWYLEAALADNETGMFNVANMYHWGWHVPQDYEKAYFYFKRLYDNGTEMGDVCLYLGIYAENGYVGNIDYDAAVRYYEEGSGLGSGTCASNLGRMYALGIGVEKDEETAFELYSIALELGDELAYANLGYCFETGQGVEQDLELAISFYKKGAEFGEEHCIAALEKGVSES